MSAGPSVASKGQSLPEAISSKSKNSTVNVNLLKPTIRFVDMDETMQMEAMKMAVEALGYTEQENDVARYMKRGFDFKYPTSAPWHCIVGRNFGSYVTHHRNHFIYFYCGNIAVLLFKAED